MSTIAERLKQVLASADQTGVRYVRRRHVAHALFQQVADLTYAHVRSHAHKNADGELVSEVKILQWWGIEADLTEKERDRLFSFRSDVVRRLTDDGLVEPRHPQSTRLYLSTPGVR